MHSAAWASYRSAAGPGEYEEEPRNPRGRLHCEHCGAFLPSRWDAEYHHPDVGHVLSWGCKRCGRQHTEVI